MEAFLALLAVGIIVLTVQYNCDKVESLIERIVGKLFSRFVQRTSINELQSTIQNALFCLQCTMVIFDLVGIIGFIRAIKNGSFHFGVTVLAIELSPRLCNILLEQQYQKFFTPTIVKCAKIATALYFNQSIATFTNTGLLILSLLSSFLIKKASCVLLNVGIDGIVDSANIDENSLHSIVSEMVTRVETFVDTRCEDLEPCQTAVDICNQALDIITRVEQRIDNFYQDATDCTSTLYACKIAGSILFCLFFLHSSYIYSYIIFIVLIKFVVILVDPVTPIHSAMDKGHVVIKQKCGQYKRALKLAGLTIRAFKRIIS